MFVSEGSHCASCLHFQGQGPQVYEQYKALGYEDPEYAYQLQAMERMRSALVQKTWTRVCPFCKQTFETTAARRKYCTQDCRDTHYALLFAGRPYWNRGSVHDMPPTVDPQEP